MAWQGLEVIIDDMGVAKIGKDEVIVRAVLRHMHLIDSRSCYELIQTGLLSVCNVIISCYSCYFFKLKSSSTPRLNIIKSKFLIGHYWEN